jgi:DNA mismatch repair protein MutL
VPDTSLQISQNYDKHDYSDLQRQNNQIDARYIGTVLGVFLVAEKDQTLYLIDQHAAHERILYNRFMENLGNKQPLLFPYVIETESEQDDDYLQTLLPELEKAGFKMKNRGSGSWEVSSVPVKWTGTEEDLAEALLKEHIKPKELTSKLAATAACKAAVKDGTILDTQTAADLAAQALALPDPHCPHGRPIYAVFTKETLFQLVRRTE